MAGARCRRPADRAGADRHPGQRRRRGQYRAGRELPLSKLRGQVTHLPLDVPRHPAAAGGLPRSLCNAAVNGIVCAGATYDNDDDPRCAPAASRKT
jgi:hypothetical protein